jgi:hypothetical protein
MFRTGVKASVISVCSGSDALCVNTSLTIVYVSHREYPERAEEGEVCAPGNCVQRGTRHKCMPRT